MERRRGGNFVRQDSGRDRVIGGRRKSCRDEIERCFEGAELPMNLTSGAASTPLCIRIRDTIGGLTPPRSPVRRQN